MSADALLIVECRGLAVGMLDQMARNSPAKFARKAAREHLNIVI